MTENVRKAYEKLSEAQVNLDALEGYTTGAAHADNYRKVRQSLEHAKSYVLALVDAKTARKIAHPDKAAEIDGEN